MRARQAARAKARLARQFDVIKRRVPATARFVTWLQARNATIFRVQIAILMVLGGMFSFLPVLGLWMLPFGLMLLAVDLPFLQGPVTGAIIRLRRRASIWARWRRIRRNSR